jgi:uncharacterized membrane protein
VNFSPSSRLRRSMALAQARPRASWRARAAYEGPWDFWNGVRTVFSCLAFVALVGACLLREDHDTR